MSGEHRAYQPYRPAANLLLSKKWDDAAYDLHRSKVRESRTYLDTTAPKTYMHLQLKLKKLQVEEERLAVVERDNRMLLEKMATIMRTRGMVDHRNDYEHKSLNREKRNRELLEVAQQNQAILRRIQARQANYSHEGQQREYFQSEEFRANITRFPDPNAMKTSTHRPHKEQSSSGGAAAAAGGDGEAEGGEEGEESGAHGTTSPAPPPKRKSPTPPPAKAASPPPNKAASPPPPAPPKAASPPPAQPAAAAPVVGRPSLAPAAGFDAVAAAQELRKAMKGLGTDEDAIVKVVGRCTYAQRQEIVKAYTATIERDLLADLKSELSGDFQKLTLSLFEAPDNLTADFLNNSIKNNNVDGIISVLSLTSPEDIEGVRVAYEARHGGLLADAVAGVVEGPLKSVLAAWCTGSRDVMSSVDTVEATSVAIQISIDDGNLLVEESLLLTTMTVVAPAQLAAVAGEYAKAKGYSLLEAVEKAGHEGAAKILKKLIAAGEDACTAAAEVVHRAIEGWGTDDQMLIWVVATRAEKDLATMGEKYQALYGKSMVADIKADTSGDYEAMILALLSA